MASTTANANRTKRDAKQTGRDAKATARSASRTTRNEARKVSRETRRTERRLATQGRRIVAAAQREVEAVAAQPTRPAFFALGLTDRGVGTARSLPKTVTGAPGRLRDRLVGLATTAGDLADSAQRGYTDIARDGEKLVRAVRRQESTQRAASFAERAQSRGEKALGDAEKAVEAGAEAAQDALAKLG
jgi:hypothetical protein